MLLEEKNEYKTLNEKMEDIQNGINERTFDTWDWVDVRPTIKFAKVRSDAIIPSKRDEDGCYDVYACFDGNELTLSPFTTTLVPTGIASAFDSSMRISLRERGSNTKVSMKVSAGQIDSGFRGEYFVALYNGNSIPIEISKSINKIEITDDFIRYPASKAICQMAIEIVPTVKIEEITYDELKAIPSERGIGQLGSSGK